MSTTRLRPESEAQIVEAVRWAVAAGQPLEIVGHGTRRWLGRPVQATHTLDLSGLSGILAYEPEELLLTALPGTPLAEIEAVLAARGQALAFEPPAGGTLGGIVSAGLAGPRRFKAGAVRDHVLAVTAVSGRGEPFKAGGKVVKNVTGYDLPKLLTGAFGTLGVLTEVTLKVLPAPPLALTLVLAGLEVGDAVDVLAEALGSPAEVSGAAWTDGLVDLPGVPPRTPSALLRLEGVPVSVAARLEALRTLLAGRAAMAVLEGEESAALWWAIRDLTPLSADPDRILWRLSLPPSEAPAAVAGLRAAVPRVRLLLDQGGGTVWASLAAGDARADTVRGCLAPARDVSGGGHATLWRAPEAMRATVAVFQPQPAALAALTGRVKAQFDPARLLNPGRMWPGV